MGSDDKKTTVVLDLDNKEFVKKISESLGLVRDVGDAENLQGLVSTFLKVGQVAAVATAAVLAAKVALDLTLEAEQVKQVETSFENLAESAGLAADVLKNDLAQAARGLADDTDILKAANKGIIALGSSAARMPEIMEAARKATAAFGGDLVQNFEALNQALANGNTRALKQYGIVIDSEKAVRAYAKSIGTTAEYLSESGRKQAILTAALEQAKTKFKDISEESTKATQGFQRFKVAIGQLHEAVAVQFQKQAGGTVERFFNVLAGMADMGKKALTGVFGDAVDKAGMKVEGLEQKVQFLNDSIKKQKDFIKEHAEGMKDAKFAAWAEGGLKSLEAQLEATKKALTEAKGAKEDAEKAAGLAPKKGGHEKSADEIAQDAEDQEKLKKARLQFQKDLLSIQRDGIAERLNNARTEDDAVFANLMQRQAIEQDFENQRQELARRYLETGVADKEQFAQMEATLVQNKNEKLIALEEDLKTQRLRALDQYQDHALNTADGISRAFEVGARKAQMDMDNFGRRGKVVFDAFEKNAVNSLLALGDGSKDAGEAMKGFMFGALADIAEAEGRVMLLQAFHNPAAGAAGAALIVLAGVLRGMSGSKGKGESVSSGGATGGGGSQAEAYKPEMQDQNKKAVTLQIQGNYYETEQTRTRLMEMIREVGDFTDFNLKQVGK